MPTIPIYFVEVTFDIIDFQHTRRSITVKRYTLSKTPGVPEKIVALDRELAISNKGAYIVVTGVRT